MIVTVDNQEVQLPDFFIVGAAKSATTSLYTYLRQHPQVYIPRQKELYFFAFAGETPTFKLADGRYREPVGYNQTDYFHFYEKCPTGAIAGDTSTWYLYYHQPVIANLKKMYGSRAGELKIIMVLRNPIERAWSHYCMHQGQGLIDLPFREVITSQWWADHAHEGYYPGYDYIGFGRYAHQVKTFLNAFPHVKIVLYEEVNRDSTQVVNDMFQFLGLKPLEQLQTKKRLNVSGAPRSSLAALIGRLIYRPYLLKKITRGILPASWRYQVKTHLSRFLFKGQTLTQEDRQILIDIFKNDILELQKLLNRDLSHWLKP